jgi:hypothetical protein
MRKRSKVRLMFVEAHRKALDKLLEDASIPVEFYYYWNDVVNAVGGTPKLLLMCAVIECLTRTGHGKKDWEKVERVLGKELKRNCTELRKIQPPHSGIDRHTASTLGRSIQERTTLSSSTRK